MTSKHNCSNCGHYLDGKTCSVYSSNCATSLHDEHKPTRWIPLEEGIINALKLVNKEKVLV